jgi:hypothetical protein
MNYVEVKPVIDYSVRGLCCKPYPNHVHGCPNFHRKKGCPPECPKFESIVDIDKPIYAIFNKFDFVGHVERMKNKHPEWTKRQLECCLYWQQKARKVLKEKIKEFLREHSDMRIIHCPEGCGVNITETMKNVGIFLEWPPVNYTYQIVFGVYMK